MKTCSFYTFQRHTEGKKYSASKSMCNQQAQRLTRNPCAFHFAIKNTGIKYDLLPKQPPIAYIPTIHLVGLQASQAETHAKACKSLKYSTKFLSKIK